MASTQVISVRDRPTNPILAATTLIHTWYIAANNHVWEWIISYYLVDIIMAYWQNETADFPIRSERALELIT